MILENHLKRLNDLTTGSGKGELVNTFPKENKDRSDQRRRANNERRRICLDISRFSETM